VRETGHRKKNENPKIIKLVMNPTETTNKPCRRKFSFEIFPKNTPRMNSVRKSNAREAIKLALIEIIEA
jgi:hypothetical protein